MLNEPKFIDIKLKHLRCAHSWDIELNTLEKINFISPRTHVLFSIYWTSMSFILGTHWSSSFCASLWTKPKARSINMQKRKDSTNNIVTLSKYGHNALNICWPYSTDILRYIRNFIKLVLEIKVEEFFFSCVINYLLNNKTIILLNLSKYRLILANSAYGLVS